jgi:glucan biosynthesis protein C
VSLAVGGPPIISPAIISDDSSWGYFLVGGMFVFINDNYFMSLFFFFSGYFVPKSFHKKGRHAFLMERVKRFEIPFVLMTFFIGPYVKGGLQYLLFSLPKGEALPTLPLMDPGTTWFLQQLIVFSIIYAFACGKGWSPKIKCPSLCGFYGIATVLGVLGYIADIFFPTQDDFFGVPNFFAHYHLYTIFFFGGCVAQRNNWMEEIKKKSRAAIYIVAIVSIMIFAAIKLLHIYYPAQPPVLHAIVHAIFVFLSYGFMSVSVSLSIIVFFMDYVDKEYFFTEFFS